MTTLTEGRYTGDVVLFEEDQRYSREAAMIASGETLTVGAVVGKVTASGQYRLSAPGSSDGSQTPVGVLIHDDVDASAAAAAGVVLVRHARVMQQALIFHASINTPAERAAAIAALAAVGIITD